MRRLLVPTMAAVTFVTAIGVATPALAQYSAPSSTAPATPLGTSPSATPVMCQAALSKAALPALLALQSAVLAKDVANIPARVAAASALAKSNDERCFVAQMRLRAAVDANDLGAASAAIDAERASGSVPAEILATQSEELGNLQLARADYTAAASSFDRALQLSPQRSTAQIMLAETRVKQNRVGDALPMYQKALALELAAGRKPQEKWYRRALAVANQARSPLTAGLARDLVTAYPNATNWHDAVLVYGQMSGASQATMVDLYRLQRLTHSLTGVANYANYAQVLIDRGFPGEAKAMLEEGFAANTVDRNAASIKSVYAQASAKAEGDRAGLDGQSKAALSATTAKPAMVLGEAYYGYGDYAKAAAMFRAAQGKSGVDANLANLRLGMALAASGDAAGARTALAAVSGPGAEIARYWTAYLGTRS